MSQDIQEPGTSLDAAEPLSAELGYEHEKKPSNSNVNLMDAMERECEQNEVQKKDLSIRFRKKNKKSKKQDGEGLYCH